MRAPDAAPRRRRMTLVRAVKNTVSRATSSTRSTTGSELPAHRRTITYPTSRRSSLLVSRESRSQSTSSLDGLTRNSSVEVLESAAATPLQRTRERAPQLEALPTPDFYERYPRAVGPLANVLITTPEELAMFHMTARAIQIVARPEERNVSKDRLTLEDIAGGGFFVYQPNSGAPRFFLLHDTSVKVYGTASYIRR